jgi:hypothetical protein
MRTRLFTLAWVFVLLVAFYDALFAWHYRVDLQVWELNPVALWMDKLFGVGAIFALKTFSTVFATAVAAYCYRRQHTLVGPYTAVVGGVHAGLSAYYLSALWS